jgi:hypothetical protein
VIVPPRDSGPPSPLSPPIEIAHDSEADKFFNELHDREAYRRNLIAQKEEAVRRKLGARRAYELLGI